MEDLSLHILDIAENSVRAKAGKIEIRLEEDCNKDVLKITVKDNGKGMTKEEIKKAADPFFTTKNGKRTGLGLPLLAQAARESEGKFRLSSAKGKGTKIEASFKHSHIDRKPIGNMTKTMTVLIASNPDTEFAFVHKKGNSALRFNTKASGKNGKGSRQPIGALLSFIKHEMEDFYKAAN